MATSKIQNGSGKKKAAATKNADGKFLGKKSSNSSHKDESSLLEELFLDELKDIYWAEKHLTKALPKMEKAATSKNLKTTFANHLVETRGQIGRLEQAFEMMGKKAQAKKCEAMAGLTKEGDGIIEDTDKGSLTRDVGLIMAAQKVEHYEIATYGSLAQLAKTIGKNNIAALMVETLNEEKAADELLTNLAENNINVEAAAE